MPEEDDRKPGKTLARSRILAEHAAGLGEGATKNLEVNEKETQVLSYASRTWQEHYREIKVATLADIKDVIGAPDLAFERVLARPQGKTRDGIDLDALKAKISPVPKADEDPKKAADDFRMIRAAAHSLIYGDSRQLRHWVPAVEAWLRVKNPRIFIPFFNDIVVHDGGTLVVAANTLTVFANRVRLFGSGMVRCDGPTTFDCRSFEGQL